MKDGTNTSFPEHEKLGYSKAKKILDRFDLSRKEKTIVLETIGNHGIIHRLLDSNDKLKEKSDEYRKKYKNIFPEIILLSLADTMGCQLKINDPKNFKFRTKFFQDFISKY
jgi:hypothetical protein